jgi:hypothetical protein
MNASIAEARLERVAAGVEVSWERTEAVKEVVRAWEKYIFVETAMKGRLPEVGFIAVGWVGGDMLVVMVCLFGIQGGKGGVLFV